MSYPFGTANATETTIAHEVAASEQFNTDPVNYYNELLAEYGVEATGRIWSLACKLFERDS